MSNRKELSNEKRSLIVSLHKLNKSNREISSLLEVSRRTVDYNVNKYVATQSWNNARRTSQINNTG